MLILLTLLSVTAVLLLLAALIVYLIRITTVLNRIGRRPDSYLAKIRMGVRAIEVETGHLPGQVTRLNQGLQGIAGGLEAVDQRLVATARAAIRQEENAV